MLMLFLRNLLILSCAIGLVSCQPGPNQLMSKRSGGTMVGGLVGGLAGAHFGEGQGKIFATGLGAVLGAAVGASIGADMDEHDKAMMVKASQEAFEYAPSGKSVEWRNPDTKNRGSITPTKTYKDKYGQYCREYRQQVRIGDQIHEAYGTACRQPDGSWKIVSTE